MSPPAGSTNGSEERPRRFCAPERANGQHNWGSNAQRSLTSKHEVMRLAGNSGVEAETRSSNGALGIGQSVADMMSALEQLRVLNRSADGRRGHAQRAHHVYEVGDRAHRGHTDTVVELIYSLKKQCDGDEAKSGSAKDCAAPQGAISLAEVLQAPQLLSSVEWGWPVDELIGVHTDQDPSLDLEPKPLVSCCPPSPTFSEQSRPQSPQSAPSACSQLLKKSMGSDRSKRWALHLSQVMECHRRTLMRSPSTSTTWVPSRTESTTLIRRMNGRQLQDPLAALSSDQWSTVPRPMLPLQSQQIMQHLPSRPQSRTQARWPSQEYLDQHQKRRKQQQKQAERSGSRGSQRGHGNNVILQMLEDAEQRQKQLPLSKSGDTRSDKPSSPPSFFGAGAESALERPPLPSGSRERLPLSAPRITPKIADRVAKDRQGLATAPVSFFGHVHFSPDIEEAPCEVLTSSTGQIQGFSLSPSLTREHAKAMTPSAGIVSPRLGALLRHWPSFVYQDELDEASILPQQIPKFGASVSALHVVGRPCNNKEKGGVPTNEAGIALPAKHRVVKT